jgi:hypothetical protein
MNIDTILLVVIAIEVGVIGGNILSEVRKIGGIVHYFGNQDYKNKNRNPILD